MKVIVSIKTPNDIIFDKDGIKEEWEISNMDEAEEKAMHRSFQDGVTVNFDVKEERSFLDKLLRR